MKSALPSCVRFAWSLAAAALFAGCPSRATISPTTPAARAGGAASADDLALALASLRMLAEGADVQAAHRTIFYLNQWLASDPAARSDWQPDRMVENLPHALRETPGLERLAKLQFSLEEARAPWLDDISYLQQNLWLHDIATRARREPSPAELKPWLKKMEESLGLPEAEQLATAERLFDWTICNLQLDRLPPTPKGPLATAGPKSERQTAASGGEVGPGYGNLPLQTLLYGHGDAQERARVFILLCRQLGIDAILLGLTEEASATPRGWIPAVLIAGKLYLFETSLGLPIPGPEEDGIATLEQVAADPQLLRRLDVAGLPYPVGDKELKAGVVPMIDAEPAALSRRMQLLQAALPASSRLALGVQPSQLAAKLRQSKVIVPNVSLWRAPFEAILYRIGSLQAMQQKASQGDMSALWDFQKLNAVFAPDSPLMLGRNLHLQGRFEKSEKEASRSKADEQKQFARALYMQCRPPDLEMGALEHNEFFRKTIGLEGQLPEDPAKKKAALDRYVGIARERKYAASYWLGLTYMEEGKNNVAIEWLGQRTVQTSPPSPWTPGARYNLARCYERLGNWELARQWLESDKDSPQRHGNLLRAQRLAKLHPAK